MHASLKRWLTTPITQHAYLGQDGYGAPTYAAPVIWPGRLEASVRRFVDATGTERVSRSRLFFDELVPFVSIRDQLVLPDGTSPPILQVDAVLAPLGTIDHWQVLI